MSKILITKLKNLNISHTVSIAFGILVSLTFLVAGGNYIGSTVATKTIRRTQKLRVPTAITSAQAEADLLRMLGHVRGYLATGESQLRDRYQEVRQEFEQELELMITLAANGSSTLNQQRLQDLETKYEQWKVLPYRLFRLRDNYLINQPALKLLKDEGEVPIAVILRQTALVIEEQSQRDSSITNTLLLKDLADYQSSFALLVSSLRGYLVTKEPSFRFEYAAQVQANQQAWQKLKRQQNLFTQSQQLHLAIIANNYRAFFALSAEMFTIVEGDRSREDLYLLNQEVEPLTAEMLSLLEEIVTSEQEALSRELAKGSENLIVAQWQALAAGAIAFLMAIIMGLWLRHKIAAPILRLTETTTSIMAGDFEAQAVVESNDEIGFLANTFNQMIRYLKQIHGDLAEYSHSLEASSQELAQAKEAAEAANYAKSAFLANMSHELRTPLNVILGFSQVMYRDATATPQQKETLRIINQSGEHLLALINDVLEVTKIEAGKTSLKLNNFDLHYMLDSLAEMLGFKAEEKGLKLVFERSPDVPAYIQTDQGKVRQILINLINNAIKFTDRGEVRLTVTIQESKGDKGTRGTRETREIREIRGQGESHVLSFAVQDTGVGISASEIQNLFNPFVQTEAGVKSQQGTGLGLSIGRKFARLIGGDITVESQLQVGSTFTLTLPVKSVAVVESSPQPVKRAISLAPGQPQYRILVVDDKPENCLLINHLLTAMGFEVKEAANGKEAIEVWCHWQPHLILMDIHMPVMNGIDATIAIKAQTECPIPILALTASAFAESKREILQAGCDDFLTKPIKDELLFDKIAQYIPVTYIYEAIEPAKTPLAANNQDLNLKNLSFMPSQWQEQVNRAASQLDEDALLKLIDQIPDEQNAIAKSLRDKIENLDFDLILQLTQ